VVKWAAEEVGGGSYGGFGEWGFIYYDYYFEIKKNEKKKRKKNTSKTLKNTQKHLKNTSKTRQKHLKNNQKHLKTRSIHAPRCAGAAATPPQARFLGYAFLKHPQNTRFRHKNRIFARIFAIILDRIGARVRRILAVLGGWNVAPVVAGGNGDLGLAAPGNREK
jgi:hypothetical protein